MAPGDDQSVHFPWEHGPVRRVIVPPARDGIGEVDAVLHVVLRHHVLAIEEPRLADAQLRRHVDHEAALETRKVRPHIIHHRVDPLPAFEVGTGDVLDLEAVKTRHVRTVAPHDAGQRRLQPPQVPGPAHDALGLTVDLREFLRLLAAKTLGGFGINSAEPEDGRQDVRPLRERSAGGRGDVEVAGRIDDHVAHDRLAARFRLAQDAPDAPVLDDRFREPGMKPDVDAALGDHLVRDPLPTVGIERRSHDDGGRLGLGPEIEHAPSRPLPIGVPCGDALLRGG